MNIVVNNHNIIEILIVTFLISFLMVKISKGVAAHIGAIDLPNERKVHKKPMPRLGGLGIYCAFLFGYIMYGTLSTQMLSILISSFIIFVLGLLDDIKPLKAKDKFLVQLLVGCIVVFYGKLYFNEISILGLTLNFPTLLNQLFSIFFVVASINAINLTDGLDGLCGGITTIYFVTIAIIAFIMNRLSGLDVILCLIMVGSILGYLVQNFPPAKTFMGDCGSTFLGLMVAIVALLGYKVTTITSLVIPLLLLAIPIFDTGTAILRRIIHHKGIGEPDKNHLHHQFLKMKFSTRKTVLIIYFINILFSAVSIFYVLGNDKIAIIIYVCLMLILLYIVLKTDILFEHSKLNSKEK